MSVSPSTWEVAPSVSNNKSTKLRYVELDITTINQPNSGMSNMSRSKMGKAKKKNTLVDNISDRSMTYRATMNNFRSFTAFGVPVVSLHLGSFDWTIIILE